jgi:sulfur dioxygenase
MYFRQLIDHAEGVRAYLLADADALEAVVVDARAAEHALVRALLAERRLVLRWVLVTHCHHRPGEAAALAALAALAGATSVVGGDASLGHRAGDGDTITFGGEVLQVLSTPGHSRDSVSYLWRDRIFCGDALALGGCGALDGPGADAGQAYDSVTQKLFALPDETLVFPGHDRRGRTVSTIAEERARNRAFLGRTRDDFVFAFGRGSRPRTAGARRR